MDGPARQPAVAGLVKERDGRILRLRRRIPHRGVENLVLDRVADHGSAHCSPARGVTGLQHDTQVAQRKRVTLITDTTDALGRCHDPDGGGIEIVDVRIKRADLPELAAGEIGFITAQIKEVAETRVGDTITDARRPTAEPLPGFKLVQPVVFCGLFPVETDDFEDLRDALAAGGKVRGLNATGAAARFTRRARGRPPSA